MPDTYPSQSLAGQVLNPRMMSGRDASAGTQPLLDDVHARVKDATVQVEELIGMLDGYLTNMHGPRPPTPGTNGPSLAPPVGRGGALLHQCRELSARISELRELAGRLQSI
jgi:hypothetical protein